MMKTEQEIEREAEGVIARWRVGGGDYAELASDLSAAGLLVTPTLLAVWGAAKAWEYSDDSSTRVVLRDIIEAHVATLRKPERYRVNESCQGSFWAVSETINGATFDVARFYGPDAERHAREHAARLNEVTR